MGLIDEGAEGNDGLRLPAEADAGEKGPFGAGILRSTQVVAGAPLETMSYAGGASEGVGSFGRGVFSMII